jgi:hypothetical protein
MYTDVMNPKLTVLTGPHTKLGGERHIIQFQAAEINHKVKDIEGHVHPNECIEKCVCASNVTISPHHHSYYNCRTMPC